MIEVRNIQLYLELTILFAILSTGGFTKYLLFIIWVLYYLYKCNYSVRKEALYIIIPSFTCVFFGIIPAMFTIFSFETLKEAGFLLLPPLGAAVFWNSKVFSNEKLVDITFLSIITIFVITTITRFTIDNLMESQYAFIFGAYSIYYLFKRKKRHLVIAIIVLILSHKRIASVAALLGSLSVLLIKPKISLPSKTATIVKSIGVLTVIFSLIWVYMAKNSKIAVLFSKNKINSNGRIGTWELFQDYYEFSLFHKGNGLGSVSRLLKQWNIEAFSRLHNDILVWYIELGFIGFITTIFSFFLMVILYLKKEVLNRKEAFTICILIVYTLICYSTDNISIYINYLFPFYLIILSFVDKNDSLVS